MTFSRHSGPPKVIVGWPLFAFLSALLLAASCFIPTDRLPFASPGPFIPGDDATSSPVAAMILNTDHAQLAASLDADLAAVTVLSFRPRVLGYERERFGDGWAHSLLDGHYCDTRDHVLRLTFTPATAHTQVDGSSGISPSTATTRNCELLEQDPYTTTDPYTGKTISARNTSTLDIDHLFPLAAAWDLGAYRWEDTRRREFANDIQLNLVATDGATNREKSDSTLAEWLPPEADLRCGYAAAFLAVARAYNLAITEADATTAREQCSLDRV